MKKGKFRKKQSRIKKNLRALRSNRVKNYPKRIDSFEVINAPIPKLSFPKKINILQKFQPMAPRMTPHYQRKNHFGLHKTPKRKKNAFLKKLQVDIEEVRKTTIYHKARKHKYPNRRLIQHQDTLIIRSFKQQPYLKNILQFQIIPKRVLKKVKRPKTVAKKPLILVQNQYDSKKFTENFSPLE